MSYFIASSPHARERKSTRYLMTMVIACCIPGVLALCYAFGLGVLTQILLASTTAVIAEATILTLRKRPAVRQLNDYSALLTGVLIGIAIPPLAPWWIAVIGSLFAIVIAKHLYGGLGNNPFNPAMVAYVVLLISFPVQMTAWLPPKILMSEPLTVIDYFSTIFTGFSQDGFNVEQLRTGIDGNTMATPLDTMKNALAQGHMSSEIVKQSVFSNFAGVGWSAVNISFLLGGLALLKLKVIRWHIPISVLVALLLCSAIGYLAAPEFVASPLLHLFSGATMFGAFFIATDPVSGSTTERGRIIFGALIGILIYLIRTFGGFPDGVAFAVLLANICVPLLDYYTKPNSYGRSTR